MLPQALTASRCSSLDRICLIRDRFFKALHKPLIENHPPHKLNRLLRVKKLSLSELRQASGSLIPMILARIFRTFEDLRGMDRVEFAGDTITLSLDVVPALKVDPILGTGA